MITLSSLNWIPKIRKIVGFSTRVRVDSFNNFCFESLTFFPDKRLLFTIGNWLCWLLRIILKNKARILPQRLVYISRNLDLSSTVYIPYFCYHKSRFLFQSRVFSQNSKKVLVNIFQIRGLFVTKIPFKKHWHCRVST